MERARVARSSANFDMRHRTKMENRLSNCGKALTQLSHGTTRSQFKFKCKLSKD